jgi:hypothetical protein
MADALLAGRRQSALQTKWNRKLHSQRAQYEDPVSINAWFTLVEETRQRYGILDEDIYNSDETVFMMGVASTSNVATSFDTVGRATVVQPGNREWVTTIECINASGWSIPPIMILSAKSHQVDWYHNLPPDWVVADSDNGWTTDELRLEWAKHFHEHTEARSTGAYRLLIFDGHSSHVTPEFDQYCTDNKIITLCMPPHTSHRLQPLDAGCFSPLKTAYGRQVAELARQGVFHVSKVDFLWIYPQIRLTALSEQNIKAGFQATGLNPPCRERVLSSLTVIVSTPSPPGTPAGDAWIADTSHTLDQLQQQQARLVRYFLQRQSQSPTNPTSQAISKFVKGCQFVMQSAISTAQENIKLRAASQRQQRKRQKRRQYIAHRGVTQVSPDQLLVSRADEMIEEEVRADEAAQPRQRAPPTCSNCHIQGHNRTQCRSI